MQVKAKSLGEYPANKWRQPGEVFDYPSQGKDAKLPSWVKAVGGGAKKPVAKGKTKDEDDA